MIIGNLQALQQAGLPPALKQLLSSEACSLAALSARENGRFQPDGAPWFCTLSVVQTQPAAERHTEYHRQWADIPESSWPARSGSRRAWLPRCARKIVSLSPTSIYVSRPRRVSLFCCVPATSRSFTPANRTRRCVRFRRQRRSERRYSKSR